MNPYIVIAIMLVIDIITLPLIIKKMITKETDKKGLKITALIAAFVAVEVIFSVIFIDSAEDKTYYDRLGNSYSSSESVIYYDREGNEYLLCQTADKKMYFICGRMMNDAEDAYVDKNGYIVFDYKECFTDTGSDGIYKDDKSNEYYKADEVRWNKKGEILQADE